MDSSSPLPPSTSSKQPSRKTSSPGPDASTRASLQPDDVRSCLQLLIDPSWTSWPARRVRHILAVSPSLHRPRCQSAHSVRSRFLVQRGDGRCRGRTSFVSSSFLLTYQAGLTLLLSLQVIRSRHECKRSRRTTSTVPSSPLFVRPLFLLFSLP
jgi:hypothetical protein